ncbi:PREDICTED: SUMO-activating enzyme subunit 1A-like [Ipomoea nil]|uniref:SUMO-activating enzyme subunit 1A-like n=1 Tax=Ipomoea nil TaxID=35883 RepID=UPI000901EC4B|nr:PREDICTED: SUMO-activating enzyme subunit 1A-like [Ipomoea nil]
MDFSRDINQPGVHCSLSTKVFFIHLHLPIEYEILSLFKNDFHILSAIPPQKSVNAKCRKLSKRIAFNAVDVRDSCGEIFIDLQSYTYSKKKSEEMSDCQLNYPSFEEAIAVPWRGLPKRMSKLFFAMRAFRETRMFALHSTRD